jgi:hypothetical protein
MSRLANQCVSSIVRCLISAIAFVLLCPLAAVASCAPGSQPSYDDITYVKFVEYSLVGNQRPAFTFTASRWLYKRIPPNTYASLEKLKVSPAATPVPAANAANAMAAVVDVLRTHDFFAMKLTPMPATRLDGPEDSITVERCGVSTTLSTIPKTDEVNLNDAQAKAFFALEDDLRTAIFAQQWENAPVQH